MCVAIATSGAALRKGFPAGNTARSQHGKARAHVSGNFRAFISSCVLCVLCMQLMIRRGRGHSLRIWGTVTAVALPLPPLTLSPPPSSHSATTNNNYPPANNNVRDQCLLYTSEVDLPFHCVSPCSALPAFVKESVVDKKQHSRTLSGTSLKALAAEQSVSGGGGGGLGGGVGGGLGGAGKGRRRGDLVAAVSVTPPRCS